jgi:zinc-ribbon domain
MLLRWDVDDANTVTLKIGGFAKSVLAVNDREIPSGLKLSRKKQIVFSLADGRDATISVKPRFASMPEITLRVSGQLMVPTEKTPVKCPSCGASAKPNDRFCRSCGKSMPAAENYLLRRSVKEATGTIWTLGVLFAISGLIFFFLAKSQYAEALAKLNGLNPNQTIPINGVAYTVLALRDKILWAQWGVLIVNLILAAVMVGLALWGRRAPLAAVLVAAATYAVVLVTNTLIDPTSIGQGVYLKIFVVILLARGIKGALALRATHA